jgi:hypothetical protein
MRRSLSAAVALAAVAATAITAPIAAGHASPASGGTVRSDFNGDGYADLAIGSFSLPGSVDVLYGTASGPTTTGAQLWSFDSPGVPGTAQRVDGFGLALATGDFNGDGYADLAIGAPYHHINLPGAHSNGAVVVLYGSASGLTSTGAHTFALINKATHTPRNWDDFGVVLASGDFNGDHLADLAISSDVKDSRGAVNVYYGTLSGLSAHGGVRFVQGHNGVPGSAAPNHYFGAALATGDYNGDGNDDLAIGAPGDQNNSGSVTAVFGSASGLDVSTGMRFTAATPLVTGGGQMGSSLAAGDFNGDGLSDLMVGEPFHHHGSIEELEGSPTGLKGSGAFWWRGSPGFPGKDRQYQSMGTALAAGDLNGDGDVDLVVADPRYMVNGNQRGAITVLFGSATGISMQGAELITPNSPQIPSAPSTFFFSWTIATGDYDGNHHADIAIASMGDTVAGKSYGGAVFVIPSGAHGPRTTGIRRWTRATPGVPGRVQQTETFGIGLGNGQWSGPPSTL